MKKLDNFSNCLTILANADFKMAENNDIYRTGVIGQFNLTFELAWNCLLYTSPSPRDEGTSSMPSSA